MHSTTIRRMFGTSVAILFIAGCSGGNSRYKKPARNVLGRIAGRFFFTRPRYRVIPSMPCIRRIVGPTLSSS
jgi:hypothetical protein